MEKIVINDIIRDLLLDRKNRALLLQSESCRKNLPIIYDFVYKYLDSDVSIIDEAIKSLNSEDVIVFNDMLQGILTLCKDEWIGGQNPVEVIDDESLRKRCSLCNQPNNKWVYNIMNKLNGRKMNVGSTCIDEFPSIELRKNRTRTQLEKEAEKINRMKMLTIQFPRIEKTLQQWESKLDSFEILIPHELEKPYLEIGEKIRKLKEDYLNKKISDDKFPEIKEFFSESNQYISSMKEYVEDYRNERFVVTREIVSWLKVRGDLQTLETLKETGFLTYKTAVKIYEKNFLDKVIEDMNFLYSDSGLIIKGVDQDKKGFIIEPFSEEEFKLICPFGNFLKYFSCVLFGEKQTIVFNIKNIFIASDIYGNSSLELAMIKLQKVLKEAKSLFSIKIDNNIDYIAENIIDVYDRSKDKIWEVDLRKFLKEFKAIAFTIIKVDDQDISNYLGGSEYRCYSKEELREKRQISKEIHKKTS